LSDLDVINDVYNSLSLSLCILVYSVYFIKLLYNIVIIALHCIFKVFFSLLAVFRFCVRGE